MHVIAEAERTVTGRITPLNSHATVVPLGERPTLSPWMVTSVPPLAGPACGEAEERQRAEPILENTS